MRILGTVSYKGTNYAGWQKQPNVRSIQEEIENELSKFFNRSISIYGAGRTDAGVHAFGQRFHFDIDTDSLDIDRLLYSINKMLPDDIKILDFEEVDLDLHARFSAVSKTYAYSILLSAKEPFFYDTTYLYPKPLDVELLKEALNKFIGVHNFKNFTSKEEDEQGFFRNIYSIEVEANESAIYIMFKGNGFMRYMIRFIVGAAIDVASGKYSIDVLDELLDENSERHIISSKAPACGLALLSVEY